MSNEFKNNQLCSAAISAINRFGNDCDSLALAFRDIFAKPEENEKDLASRILTGQYKVSIRGANLLLLLGFEPSGQNIADNANLDEAVEIVKNRFIPLEEEAPKSSPASDIPPVDCLSVSQSASSLPTDRSEPVSYVVLHGAPSSGVGSLSRYDSDNSIATSCFIGRGEDGPYSPT